MLPSRCRSVNRKVSTLPTRLYDEQLFFDMFSLTALFVPVYAKFGDIFYDNFYEVAWIKYVNKQFPCQVFLVEKLEQLAFKSGSLSRKTCLSVQSLTLYRKA